MAQPPPEPAPTPAPTTEPAPAPTPVPAPPAEPAPVAPVDPAPLAEPVAQPLVGYDKGFFIKSDNGKFAMKMRARVQPYYTVTRTSEPKDYLNAFEVRRARLTLSGHAHTRALTYKFQTDYGKGFVTLKDFYFDVELAPKVYVRAGQWKRPFSRQQIASSSNLEMTERAITDRAFGAGRDIGLAMLNHYEKSPEVEWTVGIFNGTGDGSAIASELDPMTMEVETKLPTNVPKKFKPALIARVGLNRGGIKGYSEADLEGGPLRFGVGASVWLEGDFDDNDASNQKAEVDYILKAGGFSTNGGVYAMTEQDGAGVLDAARSLVGFHVQAGYMVVPKRVNLAARYAMITDLTADETTTRDQQEITTGLNYYAFGNDAKLATAVRFIKSGEAKLADVVVFELGVNLQF